jgi:hypothetical protein
MRTKTTVRIQGLVDKERYIQLDLVSRMITLSSWLMLYLYHPQEVGDNYVQVKGVIKLQTHNSIHNYEKLYFLNI